MGQRFFSVERPERAVAAGLRLGGRTDVYLGVCPRTRRQGSRDAIAGGWGLFADCDDQAAVEALAAFEPGHRRHLSDRYG